MHRPSEMHLPEDGAWSTASSMQSYRRSGHVHKPSLYPTMIALDHFRWLVGEEDPSVVPAVLVFAHIVSSVWHLNKPTQPKFKNTGGEGVFMQILVEGSAPTGSMKNHAATERH